MSHNPTHTPITVIHAPPATATKDQEAFEQALASERNIRSAIHANNVSGSQAVTLVIWNVLTSVHQTIVLTERTFFEELRDDFATAEKLNYEWPYYAPMSRIFEIFSRTLSFENESHISVCPQTAFMPGATTFVDMIRRGSRVPDFGGLQVGKAGSSNTEWLQWWCEVKSRDMAKGLADLVAWRSDQRLDERFVSPVKPLIKQLNIQAVYAFMRYGTPPDGYSSHPGFFAFLTVGVHFTLLHYEKPENWTTLVEEAHGKADIESISLWPKVKAVHEPILYDWDMPNKGFSHQMLYAFELLRVRMKPIYIQPSFFQPHVDIAVQDIKFNQTVSEGLTCLNNC